MKQTRQHLTVVSDDAPVPTPTSGWRKLVVDEHWQTLIDEWGVWLGAAGTAEGTKEKRNYQLRRFADAHQGIAVTAITLRSLVHWLNEQRWGSNETLRSFRAGVREFFAWAKRAGIIETDPAVDLPEVHCPKRLARPAPNDVVDRALRHPDIRARIAIAIMVETGVRRFECAKVEVRHIEHDDLGKYWLRVVGKGGNERLVPMSAGLARGLLQLPAGFVFPSIKGGHISAKWLGKIVSGVLGEGWTAHTLRHRYATASYEMFNDIRSVQELMGHSNITTTQIYCAVDKAALRRSAAGARRGLDALAGSGELQVSHQLPGDAMKRLKGVSGDFSPGTKGLLSTTRPRHTIRRDSDGAA